LSHCKKYADALKPITESKGIKVTYKSRLTHIDRQNRVATFKDLTSGETTQQSFDFLHVLPHISAPDFIKKNSELVHKSGWLDVNTATLQHNKFSNVFGLGDVCNLPTSKSAAAVCA